MREGACGGDSQRQLFLPQDGRDSPDLTETRWRLIPRIVGYPTPKYLSGNLSSVTKIVDRLPRIFSTRDLIQGRTSKKSQALWTPAR